MDYFYTPAEKISATHLDIDGDEFAHMVHVMRKKPGDKIRVVDGKGHAYDALIEDVRKRVAHCKITGRPSINGEPFVDLTLAVGVLKNSGRFDFIVEKATEIGVRTIIPLVTTRTIPRHAKTDRWQKLALAAMKQSERSVLPRVEQLTPLAELLRAQTADLRLLPHEQVKGPTLHEVVRRGSFSSATVCIGPEGGFTDEEVAEAEASGFIPASLGPRRLRTETAAIVAAASVLLPL